MRKMLTVGAVATIAMLLTADFASARGGRGGCGGRGGRGGCGGGGCGSSCHMSHGCHSGGCHSYGHSGGGHCYTGGCHMGGCSTGHCYGGHTGGYHMGGHDMGCPGGVCHVAAPAQTGATVVVSLPADAALTVDGKATASTSAERVFQSPSLEKGKDYVYTLKATVVRDGKSESVVREVTVRAGETTKVDISLPTGVAAK